MKKFLPYILILIITGGLILPEVTHAQLPGSPRTFEECMQRWRENPGSTSQADAERDCRIRFNSDVPLNEDGSVKGTGEDTPSWWLTSIFYPLIAWIVGQILKLVSLLTTISGVVLNGVIYHTVVRVGDNYAALTPLKEAWKVLRDIANIAFIFVLLYAGIKTIIGQKQDNQRLITNVVVAAVLMNFSLFLTGVVIDLSNVLALTFYDAISPGAAAGGFTSSGLSNAFMQHLSVQTLYKAAGSIGVDGLVTTGLMGSIMLIVVAFVFFAVALLFIIRYVVLLLVLILSPVAFIAHALPAGTKIGQYQKQWQDALIGQAFFAPIYFLLTWVALKVMSGIMLALGNGQPLSAEEALSKLSLGNTLSSGAFLMFMNFLIVIILIITALLVAKKWADDAGGGINKLTSWAQGAAGSAIGGGTGWAGRKTIGAGGNWLSNRAGLQEAANKERTGGWDTTKGAASRLALYASKKARSGSFDVRNAAVPTSVVSDLVEGTAGRTKIGKKMGLDEFRPWFLKDIPVGKIAADQTGAGKGGTEGYREESAAKAKRVTAEEKIRTDEYRAVKAESVILKGVNTAPTSPEYKAMEKELAKMSDKEVEAIVESNKGLLEKLSFANSISVKQLEAINKSEKFSDDEKDKLKGNRFREINVAMTTGTATAIAAVGPKIKSLSDAELEMIDPTHIENEHFVAELRPPQVDAINKSSKFTNTQKAVFREKIKAPLITALAAGNAADAQTALRKMSPKSIPALGTGTPAAPGTLLNPLLVEAYTPNMLKRMANEMNTADIQTLRTHLLTLLPITTPPNETRKWLEDSNTGAVEFS